MNCIVFFIEICFHKNWNIIISCEKIGYPFTFNLQTHPVVKSYWEMTKMYYFER
jgi:hypothetical protein